jgi:hypothetical protein
MSEADTTSPQSEGLLRRALRWWTLTGVFVLGLLVGALMVGLLAGGSPVPPGAAAGGATTPGAGGSAGATAESPSGATGELVVNDACLRAINAAQDTVDVVEGIGEAISAFNAARLDEIVRQLQPLQRRLQENVQACEVEGRLPSASETSPGSDSGSASSTTASPTG